MIRCQYLNKASAWRYYINSNNNLCVVNHVDLKSNAEAWLYLSKGLLTSCSGILFMRSNTLRDVIFHECNKDQFAINKDYFKTLYNLSQEEIDALVKDIEKEATLNGNNSIFSGGINTETIKPFDFSLIDNVKDHNEIGCFHEWEMYTGLVETFEHCKKCGKKK